jgi:hypothetical protein
MDRRRRTAQCHIQLQSSADRRTCHECADELIGNGIIIFKSENHLHRFALIKYAFKKHLGLMGVNMFHPASEVEKARSANGGWTKAKLAEFGVPWPPPKGWKRELEKRLARGEHVRPS